MSPARRSSHLRPRLVSSVMFCFLVMGCANIRALDPAAGPVVLAENEGILVVHVRTQVKLASIQLAGASPAEIAADLQAGDHLWLFAATKGSYRWRRIEREIPPVTYYWSLPGKDERWHFTVEPGKINHPGVFEFEGSEGSPELSFRTINRSAMAFADLQRRYPALLRRFPMRYAGSRRDDFLDHYLEASRATRSEEVPTP